MFKKLFIGLLLLSSLTSEGMANLPYEIYNLYFGAAFSDTALQTPTADVQYDRAANNVVKQESTSIRLLDDEKKLTGTKLQFATCESDNRIGEYIFQAYTLPGELSCKKFPVDILNKSDSSPPTALL